MPVLPELLRGAPVDVEVFARDGDGYQGALTLEVVDGALPPGLSLEGTRLVGTPTEPGLTTFTIVARPEDTSVCESGAETVYVTVSDRECISDQACHARLHGSDPCSSSSDCEGFGGLQGRCVQVLEDEGVCLIADIGCSGDIRSIVYTDTEGLEFESCGELSDLDCADPGFCE